MQERHATSILQEHISLPACSLLLNAQLSVHSWCCAGMAVTCVHMRDDVIPPLANQEAKNLAPESSWDEEKRTAASEQCNTASLEDGGKYNLGLVPLQG